MKTPKIAERNVTIIIQNLKNERIQNLEKTWHVL